MEPLHTADFRRQARAVVVGASAGGVEALMELLGSLQPGYALPVIVVLHLSDARESLLPQVFAARLALPVREAVDKEPIAPGTVYFAPPGYHLLVESAGSFALSCDAREHFSRPSINVLMESAADAWGPDLAGILLTGANDDGAAGLARVGTAGGLTVVQDPQEALAPAMPRAALQLRKPDFILPLRHIKELLCQLQPRHA